MPPATIDYDGVVGMKAAIGSMFVLTNQIRMLLDLYVRYGSFGLGEDSTRLGYGAQAAFLYHVGRM